MANFYPWIPNVNESDYPALITSLIQELDKYADEIDNAIGGTPVADGVALDTRFDLIEGRLDILEVITTIETPVAGNLIGVDASGYFVDSQVPANQVFRRDSNNELLSHLGTARLLVGGSTNIRNYFAPRLANDIDWDWANEFGFDRSLNRWYFDSVPYIGTNVIWHAGNDGATSGLDADLLDGQHGEYYLNASNLNAGTISDALLPATISSNITGDAATLGGQSGSYYLNASNLNAGTISDALLPATISSNITGTAAAATIAADANLLSGENGAYYRNASNINAGTLSYVRLGTGANERSWVLGRTADASVDAIGTYGTLRYVVNWPGQVGPGHTSLGSNLDFSHSNQGSQLFGTAPSGTWMLMGFLQDSPNSSTWLRIS